MWLGKPNRQQSRSTADVGRVTLGGNPVGVYLDGEQRAVPVFAPGGYCWRPAMAQQVLVIKSGDNRELPCVVGATQEPTVALEEGEVMICSVGGAQIWLKSDGGLDLVGQVSINGQSLATMVETVVDAKLEENSGGLEGGL